MSFPVVLGITLGDAGGIGPEAAIKAATAVHWPADLKFVLVGSASIVANTCRSLRCKTPPLLASVRSADHGRSLPPVSAWDPDPRIRVRPIPGRIRTDCSSAAAKWIRAATEACVAGDLSGMVTAPICKDGFARAGIGFPGHTEFIASLTGTKKFAMMLIGGGLRVTVVTRHIPLAEVPGRLTKDEIVDAAWLTWQGLRWMHVRERVIAVCGLNPHAGDGGAIGNEEKTIILPAIRKLKRLGVRVEGPIPADTVFHSALNGRYGAVIAMYHDQGLGPLKTVGFDGGVNVTMGLPIVRTSPDHGTAFDIAGKGIANPLSTVNAMKLAHDLAVRRNPFR